MPVMVYSLSWSKGRAALSAVRMASRYVSLRSMPRGLSSFSFRKSSNFSPLTASMTAPAIR